MTSLANLRKNLMASCASHGDLSMVAGAQSPNPLEFIYAEVQRAVTAKLHYLAVGVTLSIPDICASLECDPGKVWTNQNKYEAWCAAYLEARFHHLTARDIYRVRCGIVHRGNFGRPDDRFEMIAFSFPEHVVRIGEGVYDQDGGSRVLSLDVGIFCERVIAASRQWWAAMSNDPSVLANVPNLVRYRPEGLPPMINGLPLIA